MKKLTLALVAALSLSTAVFAEEAPTKTPVQGSSGQISFTGTVTEKGCTILAGDSANIDLGSMSVAALKAKPGAWGTGKLQFTGCNLEAGKDDKLEAVVVTIIPGGKAAFGTDLWANNGDAAGVGIEVEIGGKDGLSKVSPTNPTPLEAKIDPVNGTAIYQVRGRMVGNSEEVNPGSVETTVSFMASYR